MKNKKITFSQGKVNVNGILEKSNLPSLTNIKTIKDSEEVKDKLSHIFPLLNNIEKVTIEGSDKEIMDYMETMVLSHVFSRGIFKDNVRRKSNFIKQQMICIDIDAGVSPDKLLKSLISFDLAPNIIYSSVRDGDEKRKFRVLYLLPNGISDKDQLFLINSKFNESIHGDPSTKDTSRLFYPGKKILYRNDNIPSRNEILLKNIEEFLSLIDFDLTPDNSGGSLSIFVEDLKYSISSPLDNYMVKRFKMEYTLISKSSLSKRHFDYSSNRFKIIEEFFTCNIRYSFDILKGLMMNLRWVSGGRKRMIERLIEINDNGGGQYKGFKQKDSIGRGIEKYPTDYFNALKRISESDSYIPMSLRNFSPFEEDHVYRNLLEDVSNSWGGFTTDVDLIKEKIDIKLSAVLLNNMITKIKKEEKTFTKIISTFTDRDIIIKDFLQPKELKGFYGDSFTDDINKGKIFIIKVSTGLGKTKELETLDGMVMACYTNKLKDELNDRMKVDCVVTPDSVVFSDEDLQENIETLYAANDYSAVLYIIKQVAKHEVYKDHVIRKQDIIKCNNYIDNNKIVKQEKEKSILTTHTRALYSSFHSSLVMYDEDIIQSLITTGNLLLQDFEIFDGTPFNEISIRWLEFLKECKLDFWYDFPSKEDLKISKFFKKHLVEHKRIDFLKFFKNCDHFILRKDKENKTEITFFSDNTGFLNYQKNAVILSATVEPYLYQKIYGEENVEVLEIDDIPLKGHIVQDTRRSYSRRTTGSLIDKGDDKLDALLKEIKQNDIPLITHQNYSRFFKNSYNLSSANTKMYFGNCSGYDNYNGKDIVVLGTPHRPARIIEKFLIDKEREIDVHMVDEIVSHKQFRFKFKTYKNEVLRNLQMGSIEGDLIQAVGRARALRNDVTVRLYSNFPLYISTDFITK